MIVYWIILIVTSASVNSQILNSCPQDWVTNENTCYKFVYTEKLSYEQARTACAYKFATLLSIDSFSEHQFVINYLLTTDYFRNTWLTRGIQDYTDKAKWNWDGDATPIPVTYWLPQQQSVPGAIIVYMFQNGLYGWSRSDKSTLLSYICEIPQSLAYKLTTEQRTFEYGVPFQNLTNIEKGPIFQDQPKSLVVVSQTSMAQIECRAACNPVCQYKWYRGQSSSISDEVTTTVDSRYTLTNGKLTIQNPSQNLDASNYQCRVSNKFGTVLSNPVQLAFGAIGEFSNVQDAPVYAKAYEGSAIQCSQIKTNPAGTYIWLRGRPPETIFPETTPYAFMSANGRLYFSEVTLVDALEYYCQVSLTSLTTTALGTSQAPSRISRPIRMIVQQQAPKTNWGPEIQDDFIYVSPERPLKGYNVRLECFAYGSAINYEGTWRYEWSRKGSQIPKTAKFTDFNRVMTIENAQAEDEGNYVCTVSRGTTASHQKNLYLRLYAVPYFLLPLQAQHVDMGSDLTWKCEASGYPYPTYSWYKDGMELKTVPGEITVSGNTLTITSLQQKHNGMYQCSAMNYLGTSMSEAQLRVLAFKPSFSKKPLPQQMYGAVRGNITMQCRPEAAPAPLIEWYFGSGQVSISEKYRKQPNGDLVISGLSAADAGLYRCKATNSYGEAESAGTLIVKGDVAISLPPPIETRVVVNESAFIRCEASFDPELDLTYIWSLNGHVIDIEKDFFYELEMQPGYTGLRIKLVQFKHEGMYECVAQTPVNEARASGYLRVRGPPDEPAGVSADTPGTTSLMVHWYIGDDNGSPVEYYAIQYCVELENGEMSEWDYIPNDNGGKVFEVDVKALGDARSDRRSYLVNNLKPGNQYQFRVASKNSYSGISIFSYPSEKTKTNEAAPIEMVAEVFGGNGSVGDLHIKWTEMPYEDRGDHTSGGYYVYWRLYKEGNNGLLWSKRDIPNWKTTFNVELVGRFNYYLQYEIKVQGYNRFGNGPNATAVIYSSDGMPEIAPSHVWGNNINSTASEVTWDTVDDSREVIKGRLGGYQVNYYKTEEEEPVYKQYIRFPGQVGSGVCIGMIENTWYSFQVQVYNSAGLGPTSEYYKVESLHLVNQMYPLEVKVSSHGPSSVLVTWRGITITWNEATVLNYRLYLWPANEHYRTAKEINTKNVATSFVLENLEKSVIYALRIGAYSMGGEGKKSPTIYFTLGGSNIAIDQTLTEFQAGTAYHFISFVVLIGCLLLSMLT